MKSIKIYLAVVLSLVSMAIIAQPAWNQLGSDIDGSMGDGLGNAMAMSTDGSIVAVGAASANSLQGLVKVYQYNGSSWEQLGSTLSGSQAGDSFGSSVSLSADGTTLAVGARTADGTFGSNSVAGYVNIYTYDETNGWLQKGSTINAQAAQENFGQSVSISSDGNVLAIGVPGADGSASAAGTSRVYKWKTSAWEQVGADLDGDTDYETSGMSVSLAVANGDTIVAIGSPIYTTGFENEGRVRIFKRNTGVWSVSDEFVGKDYFNLGTSVSLSNDGTRLGVGAPQDLIFSPGPYFGLVIVYEYSTSWEVLGDTIKSSLELDQFGNYLDISGDGSHVIIGAPGYVTNDNQNGRAEIWSYSTNWEKVGVSLEGEAEFNVFGTALAISEDGSIVGAGSPINDGGGADAGHVRIFKYSTPNVAPVITASQSFDVSENAVNNTSVGTVQATDVNEETTFSSWTITAGNSVGVFAIDASTGEITVADNTSLDSEVTPSYTLTLTVSDGELTSNTETININVVDPAAVFTSASTINFAENSTAVAYTAETNETSVTFSLGIDRDEALFTLANENQISFTDAPDYETALDANADNVYEIEVIAEDDGGNITSLVVTITVTDVVFEYSGGAGTEANPFLIATKADLKDLSENSSEWALHFRQTADIVFDAVDFEEDGDFYNDGLGFSPIGNDDIGFSGSYDGNGHTITGLVMDRPEQDYIGFFGFVTRTGVLKNLGLVDVNVIGHYYLGGLVSLNSGDISRCYVTGSVSGEDHVGGLIGAHGGIVSDCYATSSVTSTGSRGGLIGDFYDSESITATNCYSTGFLSYNGGGLIGTFWFDYNNINNSFWNTETSGQSSSDGGTGLTTAEMQDQASFTDWDFTDTWHMDNGCVNNGFPILAWQANPEIPIITVESAFTFDTPEEVSLVATANEGSTISWFASEDASEALSTGSPFVPTDIEYGVTSYWVSASNDDCSSNRQEVTVTVQYLYSPDAEGNYGDGSEENPFLIATESDLIFLSEHSGDWDKHFMQSADIEIAQLFGWIGGYEVVFSGTYDGDGFKIIGMQNTMFGKTANSLIANVYLVDVDIDGYYEAGGLVNTNGEGATIRNCAVIGTINLEPSSGNGHAGGLVDYNLGSIYNCYTSGTLIGDGAVFGGLVASNGGYIEKSYSTMNVSGSGTLGGLIGSLSTGTVSSSYWNTETSGLTISDGGIGLTTAEMQDQTSFSNWDFSNTWQMDNGCVNNGFPILAWQENLGAPELTVSNPEPQCDETGAALEFTLTVNATAGEISWYDAATDGTLLNIGESYTVTINESTSYWVEATNGQCSTDRVEVIATVLSACIEGSGTETEPYLISNKAEFLLVSENPGLWSSYFKQDANIVFETSDFDSYVFQPVGSLDNPFTATYDGGGHTISGLKVDQTEGALSGMFGYVKNGVIKNLGLINAEVIGGSFAGGIVAVVEETTLDSVFFEGSVTADQAAGGLVGLSISSSSISHSYFIGAVESGIAAGGLASAAEGGSVSIDNSYARGSIEATSYVAGLAMVTTSVTNSYAAVQLLGSAASIYPISYNGTVVNSFWDVELSGVTESEFGKGLTTAEMKDAQTIIAAGWSLDIGEAVWQIANQQCINDGYPLLAWQENPEGYDYNLEPVEAICSGETVNLKVTTDAPVVNWYPFLEAQDPAGTGMEFTSAPITETTSYWYEVGEGDCFTARKEVVLDINSLTVSTSEEVAICDNNTLELTAESSVSTATINWYAAADASDPVFTGVTFIPEDQPTEAISYWVEASTGTCTSERIEIKVVFGDYCYSGGTGSKNNPFIISNSDDLKFLSENIGQWNYHYALANDIEYAFSNFKPIGDRIYSSFTGSFDGQGHTISNLTFSPEHDYQNQDVAMFGYVLNKARIANLNLNNLQFNGFENVGGLVGRGSVIVENCHVSGTISGHKNVGGLVGLLQEGLIISSSFDGNVEGSDYYPYGESMYEIVEESSQVGGLAGEIKSGTVIKNSHNKATVSGTEDVGGIVGNNMGSIRNSHNAGAVTALNRAGGIAAKNSSVIFRCSNSGELTSTSNSRNGKTGGIVGMHYIPSNEEPGLETPLIEECFNIGNVIGQGGFAGGIIGRWVKGDVINSYNHGQITRGSGIIGDIWAGGHIGKLINSYSVGKSSTGISWSISGNAFDSEKIENCFWDTEASGTTRSQHGVGRTTEEMQTQSTFANNGWMFNEDIESNTYPVWVMDTQEGGSGYPILLWQTSPTYEVSGQIIDENGDAFTDGKVSAYIRDKKETRLFDLDDAGGYNLRLFEGNYVVKVTPNDQSTAGYYITYLGNTVRSDKALTVAVDGVDISVPTIQMIARSEANLLNGEGKVRGRVIDGEGADNRLTVGRILEGTPVSGVSVFLIRVSDEQIMTEVISDENGDFEIAGIPEGEYVLQVNIDGVPTNLGNSTLTFGVNASSLTVTAVVSEEGVTLSVENVLGVEDEIKLSIYPNPATRVVNVQVSGEASVRIIDLKGTVITEQSFTNEIELNVENLKESIYLMEIRNAEGVSVRKLIKK